MLFVEKNFIKNEKFVIRTLRFFSNYYITMLFNIENCFIEWFPEA